LRASLIRGNIIPDQVTTGILARKLCELGAPDRSVEREGASGSASEPESSGKVSVVRGVLEVLKNTRYRLPLSDQVYDYLLHFASHEKGGQKLVREFARSKGLGLDPLDSTKKSGTDSSCLSMGKILGSEVASCIKTEDYAQAVRALETMMGGIAEKTTGSRVWTRRTAFLLFFSLNNHKVKEKSPWGLSVRQLKWLAEEPFSLLTSPLGKKLVAEVRPVLVAAIAKKEASAVERKTGKDVAGPMDTPPVPAADKEKSL